LQPSKLHLRPENTVRNIKRAKRHDLRWKSQRKKSIGFL
jgi:hypothetical protein